MSKRLLLILTIGAISQSFFIAWVPQARAQGLGAGGGLDFKWLAYVKDLKPGDKVQTKNGEVILGEAVGEGQTGRAFLLEGYGRQAVIKFQLENPAGHYGLSLRAEVRSLNLLREKGLDPPKVFSFQEQPGPFLIKEFVDGKTLADFFGAKGAQIPLAEKLAVVSEVRALESRIKAQRVNPTDFRLGNVAYDESRPVGLRARIFDPALIYEDDAGFSSDQMILNSIAERPNEFPVLALIDKSLREREMSDSQIAEVIAKIAGPDGVGANHYLNLAEFAVGMRQVPGVPIGLQEELQNSIYAKGLLKNNLVHFRVLLSLVEFNERNVEGFFSQERTPDTILLAIRSLRGADVRDPKPFMRFVEQALLSMKDSNGFMKLAGYLKSGTLPAHTLFLALKDEHIRRHLDEIGLEKDQRDLLSDWERQFKPSWRSCLVERIGARFNIPIYPAMP